MRRESTKRSLKNLYVKCQAQELRVEAKLWQLFYGGKLSRRDRDTLLQSRDSELRWMVAHNNLSFALAERARGLMDQHGLSSVEACKVLKNQITFEQAIASADKRRNWQDDQHVDHQMRVYYARQRAEEALRSEKNVSPADIYLHAQRLPGHYGANQ